MFGRLTRKVGHGGKRGLCDPALAGLPREEQYRIANERHAAKLARKGATVTPYNRWR
jgi:hypothetical protein